MDVQPYRAVILFAWARFMLDFIKFFLPFVAAMFVLLYVFLINPDVLTAFGWWLRDTF